MSATQSQGSGGSLPNLASATLRAKFAAERSRDIGRGTSVGIIVEGRKHYVITKRGFDYYERKLKPYIRRQSSSLSLGCLRTMAMTSRHLKRKHPLPKSSHRDYRGGMSAKSATSREFDRFTSTSRWRGFIMNLTGN